VFVGVLLGACGNDLGVDGPVEMPEMIGGAELYRDNCARCHGSDGAGGSMGPQVLSPVRAYATYVVRHGRGAEMGFMTGMDPFDATMLADGDLTQILDWLAAAPKPATGEGLYVRFCGNCHGANAQGGRSGKDLTSELDELEEKVREGHGGARFGDRKEYMPAWTGTEITDAELEAIRAYVASLPPGPGDDDDDD
jgi:cytochrome c oxidase cbb3-type subunit 3